MNCDGIARWYRWLEYAGFGRALERRRGALLHQVTGVRRALVLGDGDGRGAAALLRVNSQVEVDYVELSARMLDLARARAGSDRVMYHRADALTMPLKEGAYDLVVTHFFLDCFDAPEQRRLVERVRPALCEDGRWLVSEFRRPGLLVALLYRFFNVTTGLRTRELVDHHLAFGLQGFRMDAVETAFGARLVSELWSNQGYRSRSM